MFDLKLEDLLVDFKNVKEDLIPGEVGAEVLEGHVECIGPIWEVEGEGETLTDSLKNDPMWKEIVSE